MATWIIFLLGLLTLVLRQFTLRYKGLGLCVASVLMGIVMVVARLQWESPVGVMAGLTLLSAEINLLLLGRIAYELFGLVIAFTAMEASDA